jgi:hypothetical protein
MPGKWVGIAAVVALCAGAGCTSSVDSPEARYEATVRARAWYESGRLGRAAGQLEDLAEDTNDPVAWTNLGWVLRRDGKAEAAERAWSRALAADHTCLAAGYWLGVSRHERGQWLIERSRAGGRRAEKERAEGEDLVRSAAQVLESIAGANPSEPAIPRALAAVYHDLGQDASAARMIDDVHRLDPAGLATLESSGLSTLQLPRTPHGASAGQITMKFDSQPCAVRATGVSAADLDGDGRWELLVQGGSQMWHADSLDGGIHWTARPLLATGVLLASVRADIDGDDRTDLVLLSRRAPVDSAASLTPANPTTSDAERTAAVPSAASRRNRGRSPAPVADPTLPSGPTQVWLLRASGGSAEPLVELPDAVTLVRAADLDHDGDTDLVAVTTGSPAVRVWRNTGGRLDFATPTPGFEALSPARDLVCGDWNGDHRIDIACIDRSGRIRVLLQAADARFVDTSAMAGLTQERARTLAAADFDADGWTDLLLGNDTGLWIYANRGAARFVRAASYRVPQTRYPAESPPRVPVVAMQLVDLDNDGLQDVLTLHPNETAPRPAPVVALASAEKTQLAAVHVPAEDAAPEPLLPLGTGPSSLCAWRNDGRGVLFDATQPLDLPGDTLLAVAPAAGDFDGDGDLDLACVTADSSVVVKWNTGGNANRHLLVELAGDHGLRDGNGARFELHASGLAQSFEVLEQPVWVGIRNEKRIAALRVAWPDGMLQSGLEIPIPKDGRLRWSRVTKP